VTGPVLLVVDAANVVGTRPDGWWRDRAAATRRLRDELAPIGTHGLPGLAPPVEVVLVVEGAARGTPSVEGARVVAAPGSGDDAIVQLVRAEPPARRTTIVVVTADRALRDRVTALGALVRGPRWVLPEPGRHLGDSTGGSPATVSRRARRRSEPNPDQPGDHPPGQGTSAQGGNRTATPEAPSGDARPRTG
jgi:hypothetical protein